MKRKTWADLEAERCALGPRKLSRAAWARRAGISESAITKGLTHGRRPQKAVREKVEGVLDVERQMADLGGRIEEGL